MYTRQASLVEGVADSGRKEERQRDRETERETEKTRRWKDERREEVDI